MNTTSSPGSSTIAIASPIAPCAPRVSRMSSGSNTNPSSSDSDAAAASHARGSGIP